MSKLLWYLKQLLPLKYATTYREDGKRYREVWRMWFGRCFAIHRERILMGITGDKLTDAIYAAAESAESQSHETPLMMFMFGDDS